MISTNVIDGYLIEAADLLPVESIDKHNDLSWSVHFESGEIIEAFYSPEQHKITLQTNLGIPPKKISHFVNRLLLQYSFNWPESGGIQMALNPDDDSVIQIFQLFSHELTVQILINTLLAFFERAKTFSEMIIDENFLKSSNSDDNHSISNKFMIV